MVIISDCYWMLDAILEYISTSKLPHVFLEDNVKISNNTIKHLTERLKDNDFHKLEYINFNFSLLNTNHQCPLISDIPKLLLKVIQKLHKYLFHPVSKLIWLKL